MYDYRMIRVDGIAWTGRHNDTLYRSFGTW